MFTIYDLRDIIQTAFWGGMLVLILIGWGILKANQARMRFYVAWLVIVPAGFLALILPSPKEYREAKERKQRYETAKAIFEQQCKNAGEKIYRTVDNVEGIMLLRVMQDDGISRDTKHHNSMWDDAVLRSSTGYEFIGGFLGMYIVSADGYAYVDVLQENKKDVIRYIATNDRLPSIQSLKPKNPARYAVTFEHNIDPELRKHWVAGVTIKIIDRKNNELMAEKIIYTFETGLGSKAGARLPWALAMTCENERTSKSLLHEFVMKILKPRNLQQETQNPKN